MTRPIGFASRDGSLAVPESMERLIPAEREPRVVIPEPMLPLRHEMNDDHEESVTPKRMPVFANPEITAAPGEHSRTDPIVALAELGLNFDPLPSSAPAKRPVPIGYGILPDRSHVAVVTLEIHRFEIAAETSSSTDGRPERAWLRTVGALGQLERPHEFWHVMATRRQPARDGSALRAGWVCVGRGANSSSAGAAALEGMDAFLTIAGAFLDFVLIRPADDPEALLDLLRPLGAPFLCSLRRVRWKPPLGVTSANEGRRAPAERPGVWLPWGPPGLSWAPLVEAMAARVSPSAFVVRLRTQAKPAPSTIEQAERDTLAVARAREQLLAQRVSDAVQLPTHEAMMRAASDRLGLLHGPCFAIDATVASWEPASPGFLAIAVSSLQAPAAFGQNGEPVPLTPVSPVALPPAALAAPLDPASAPQLLVGPVEAACLFRTAEPPSDERSPLPCSRVRVLPLRYAPDRGLLLGFSARGTGERPVLLGEEARFQHVHIVGKTSTGKSTLLLTRVSPFKLPVPRSVRRRTGDGRGVRAWTPGGDFRASPCAA